MSINNPDKWDWAKRNTIYDIKMLIPSGVDTIKYAVQGVWDTEGSIRFSFAGDAGLPGRDNGDTLWGIITLKNLGFWNMTGVGADGSIYYPTGDWTLKIWYRKLLTV